MNQDSEFCQILDAGAFRRLQSGELASGCWNWDRPRPAAPYPPYARPLPRIESEARMFIAINFAARVVRAIVVSLVLFVWIGTEACLANDSPANAAQILFCIGTPDGRCSEFGLFLQDEWLPTYEMVHKAPVFTVGTSQTRDWPFVLMPYLLRDRTKWPPYTLRFYSSKDETRPLYLLIGLVGVEKKGTSEMTIRVGEQTLPVCKAPYCKGGFRFMSSEPQRCETVVVEIPAGCIHKGQNTIVLGVSSGRLVFDYLALSTKRQALPIKTLPPRDLLREFRKGPMAGVEDIVFAVRTRTREGHWYANFGYTYATEPPSPLYGHGGRLCRLKLSTRKATVLLDDPQGSVRDPVVHYDARKILFSYRKGGEEHYHLYEIDVDGSHARQLTDGPYDDIEPCYLPAGGIVFVSSRCNRFVNCWMVPVAVVHRCDGDGKHIQVLSSNVEQDNTPWCAQ